MYELLAVATGSAGAGYILGWALRKLIGVLETVVALYVGATAVLVYVGVLSVNVSALTSLLSRLTSLFSEYAPQVASLLASSATLGPFAIGFALGFFKPHATASEGSFDSPYLEE
ncbi:MAG: FUN14 domain-containing protein [Infirmifilum sp.]